MNASEKALQLVEKFCNVSKEITYSEAKQSALICVDEMLDYLLMHQITGTMRTYWQYVRTEIINYK